MTLRWRKSVEKNGFAVLPGVFAGREMNALGNVLAQVNLRRTRAGIRHVMGNSAVAALAQSPRLGQIAQAVLGSDALPFRATFFDKSLAANWLVVWHQDTALPLRTKHGSPGWGPWSTKDGVLYAHAPTEALNRVLALRVHLDDCDTSNGALRVLPGTHKQGVLTDEAVHQISTSITPVDCIVPLGGVLAMRPLLIHSSSKSHSSRNRRVLHIEYADSLAVGAGVDLAVV